MSDALEAASVAVFTEMNPNPSVADLKFALAERYARAAILAFLDAVDVSDLAKRMLPTRSQASERYATFLLTSAAGEPYLDRAASALSALKAKALADAGSHTSQK